MSKTDQQTNPHPTDQQPPSFLLFYPEENPKPKQKELTRLCVVFQISNETANFNPRRQSCVTNFAKQRRALYTYNKMTVNLSQFIRILKIYVVEIYA